MVDSVDVGVLAIVVVTTVLARVVPSVVVLSVVILGVFGDVSVDSVAELVVISVKESAIVLVIVFVVSVVLKTVLVVGS